MMQVHNINRRQATVDQWVALWIIFEVCAQQEIGYTGGGRKLPLWWRQTAEDTQLMVTLEEIWQKQGINGDRYPAGVSGRGGR